MNFFEIYDKTWTNYKKRTILSNLKNNISISVRNGIELINACIFDRALYHDICKYFFKYTDEYEINYIYDNIFCKSDVNQFMNKLISISSNNDYYKSLITHSNFIRILATFAAENTITEYLFPKNRQIFITHNELNLLDKTTILEPDLISCFHDFQIEYKTRYFNNEYLAYSEAKMDKLCESKYAYYVIIININNNIKFYALDANKLNKNKEKYLYFDDEFKWDLQKIKADEDIYIPQDKFLSICTNYINNIYNKYNVIILNDSMISTTKLRHESFRGQSYIYSDAFPMVGDKQYTLFIFEQYQNEYYNLINEYNVHTHKVIDTDIFINWLELCPHTSGEKPKYCIPVPGLFCIDEEK